MEDHDIAKALSEIGEVLKLVVNPDPNLVCNDRYLRVEMFRNVKSICNEEGKDIRIILEKAIARNKVSYDELHELRILRNKMRDKYISFIEILYKIRDDEDDFMTIRRAMSFQMLFFVSHVHAKGWPRMVGTGGWPYFDSNQGMDNEAIDRCHRIISSLNQLNKTIKQVRENIL